MKKILAILLVLIFMFTYSTAVMAVAPREYIGERDVFGSHKTYDSMEAEFTKKGLIFDDVNTLQNLGFSYEEILALPESALRSLLPLFGTKTTRAGAPSSYIRVENVGEPNVTAYFYPGSGMSAGDFYNDNDGRWIKEQVDYFIDNVYASASSMRTMYYLFGEWDATVGTHQGHDIRNPSVNSALYSLHSGVVTAVGGTYGIVAIYNADADETYIYAHMTGMKLKLDAEVNVGDFLGYQSNKGVPTAHLHFEARDGRRTGLADNKPNALGAISPYNTF